MNNVIKRNKRNSSIELLKIISLLAIVVSHITQTLVNSKSGNPYAIDIAHASMDSRVLILSLLRYLGSFGNTVFFASTAWFLVDNKGFKAKKILPLIANTWIISIAILVTSLLIGSDISGKNILRSIFPIILQTNWYITYYIVFYLLHPLLNSAIQKLSQRQHLRVAIFSSVAFILLCSLKSELLCGTKLMTWIAIYMDIAYFKKYALELFNSKKANLVSIAIGAVGTVVLLLVTNFAGLHITAISDKLQHWATIQNPFIILMAMGIFNLVRQKEFTSKVINTIASVSLYVYIIHENIIIRTYLRPAIWTEIYNRIGHNYLYVVILCMSLAFFVVSTILGLIYSKTVQRIVNSVIEKLYAPAKLVVLRIEDRLMKNRAGTQAETAKP